MSIDQILELNEENIITVCAWCRYQINKNGIRSKIQYEKNECEGMSNGICLVCAVKNFK